MERAGETTESVKRLRDSEADEVVFSLADAVVQTAKLAPQSKADDVLIVS